MSESTWQAVSLFTNRAGKFAIEGLKPGRYQLRLTRGEQVQFLIPADASGLYSVGLLRIR